jgi:hypothetical protein
MSEQWDGRPKNPERDGLHDNLHNEADHIDGPRNEVSVRAMATTAAQAAKAIRARGADQPPRCPTRETECGLWEIETDPPAMPRLWTCRNPDCDLAIRARGDA